MEDANLSELKGKILNLLETLDTEQRSSHSTLDQQLIQHLQNPSTHEAVEAIVTKHIESAQAKVDSAIKAANCEIEREMTSLTTALWARIHEEALDTQEQPLCYFSQKVHKKSSSLMISMMKYPDFKTILHIFLAMMIVMFSGVIAKDIMNQGIFVDLTLFEYALNRISWALAFWPVQLAINCTIVGIVKLTQRYNLPISLWMPMYGLQQIALYFASILFLLKAELPVGSSLVTALECARMSMKAHSYIREKMLYGFPNDYSSYLPDDIKAKGITAEQTSLPKINILTTFQELNRYLYFSFCPTLIYRDFYPRLASKRRWGKIIFFGANWFGTVVFVYLIFRQLSITNLKSNWADPWHANILLASWLDSMLPATMLLLLIFFGFFHSWQNMWAELMLFADRRFYGDWWNVSSFSAYYRKWNIVVYDWLHTYVYQDLVRFTKGRCTKTISCLITLIVADVLYELQISLVMRFVYPIFCMIFGGPGVIFVNMTTNRKQPWNIFMWVFLLVTTGFLICFYSWEYFSRQHLDLKERYGYMTTFVPHSWPYFSKTNK